MPWVERRLSRDSPHTLPGRIGWMCTLPVLWCCSQLHVVVVVACPRGFVMCMYWHAGAGSPLLRMGRQGADQVAAPVVHGAQMLWCLS
jgi:hypothetical protein